MPTAQTHSEVEPPEIAIAPIVRAHLRFGWIGLLAFVTFGTVLEALHAFKSSSYLGVGQEMRRLMWTLAHAHGIGLSLLQIAFATTLKLAFESLTPRLQLASRLLAWAMLLVPVGFFLGGVITYDGDPGLGVVLVPIGAILLWSSTVLVTLELMGERAGRLD